MHNRLLAGAVAFALAGAPYAQAGWFDFLSGGRAADRPVVLAQSIEAERINRLEGQMRTLTGQIEELEFRLRQLQDQLQRAQADSDFRFRELGGGDGTPFRPSPQPSSAPALPTPPPNAQALGGRLNLPAPVAVPAVGGATQPLDLSALARSGAPSAPLPSGDAASGGSARLVSVNPTGDPSRDYQRGYDLILSGDYLSAEETFRQFLIAYPGDQLAPDAQFWIGESYFARGQYREAADEFLAGYKAYPESAKGPDALLKLGLSLAGLGERDAACSTYAAVLKQYPQASNALRQRVVSEQAVADC